VSFILDALKKAERDRRRTHVPSLGTMHALPVERRIVWPWIVGGLVAVNAIAFVVMFGMRGGAPTAVPAPPTVVAPVTPVAPVPVTPTAPPAAPPATPVVRTPSVPSTPEARTTAATPGRPPARETPSRVEPEALRLEVLVYADDRAQRSAWINGQRFLEGQRIDGRILVEQIQRDGVMLRTETKRYLLKQE
jgi:general secretion pathway protein B